MTIYRVNVGGKEYEVKIEDANAQPVRATVNGQEVQVWVEQRASPALTSTAAQPAAAPSVPSMASPQGAAAQPGGGSDREVRAPMPGAIVRLDAAAGDEVEVGQTLCVLDAMKMNNLIRAPRAGTIAEVHVAVNQQVQYGDLLMTFADQEQG
ncbi:MAG: acetyl-CoA carboxylase biotin carboxyl carrier protein subunit [Anaerolineae bacterium]|jgi:biotin carboxyl carrier protein